MYCFINVMTLLYFNTCDSYRLCGCSMSILKSPLRAFQPGLWIFARESTRYDFDTCKFHFFFPVFGMECWFAILNLLEIVRGFWVLQVPALGKKAQLVCIPTSSGTGSEVSADTISFLYFQKKKFDKFRLFMQVTPFSVVTDDKTGNKYPLADYALTPSMAIIDANVCAVLISPVIPHMLIVFCANSWWWPCPKAWLPLVA